MERVSMLEEEIIDKQIETVGGRDFLDFASRDSASRDFVPPGTLCLQGLLKQEGFGTKI